MSRQAFYPHLSVDCVLIGFDEEGLKVLLVEKTHVAPGHTGAISKLPGDLIYEEEELDAAARRILFDMTGMSSPHLEQFHTFGAPSRIKNPADREWVEAISGQKIGRLVTVAYMAMLRISTKLRKLMESHKTRWVPVDGLPELVKFGEALEAASLQTLNDGIMTKDLCGLAEGITPTAVDSEGFIKAIRTRLEAKLA